MQLPNLNWNIDALTTTSAGELYVGGDFGGDTLTPSPGLNANHIAKWDGRAWTVLGTAAVNGAYSPVLALAAIGTNVYAGGGFREVGNSIFQTHVHSIARWD